MQAKQAHCAGSLGDFVYKNSKATPNLHYFAEIVVDLRCQIMTSGLPVSDVCMEKFFTAVQQSSSFTSIAVGEFATLLISLQAIDATPHPS